MSYLSVPKFAEKVGVTKQAIYLRIKKADPEFLKFVIKEGSITKISEEAEKLFNYRLYSNGEESEVKKSGESKLNQVENIEVYSDVGQVSKECEVIGCEEKQNNKDSKDELKEESQENKLDFASLDLLVKHLQEENKDLKSQINTMLEIQNKQLDQIQHLYNQIDDKDKLITELSRRITEQTRLPVLVQAQKQTLWQKIKWTFFSKTN